MTPIPPEDDDAIDDLPMALIPDRGRLAIIGAGGGKQVQRAIAAQRGLQVDAFELEPAVVHFLTQVQPLANGGAYVHPDVHVFAREGRTGVRTGGPYDFIYLADPGTFQGFLRSLLSNHHFLHTVDAYADYVKALKPDGFIGVLVMRQFDAGAQTSRRILNAMHAHGLASMTLQNRHFTLILASRRSQDLFARARDQATAHGLWPPDPTAIQDRLDNPMPSDDRGGSYVFELYSLAALSWFFRGSLILACLAVAGAIVLVRRRSADPATGGRMVRAVWLGSSFVLLENALILQLSRILLDLTDAALLGSAVFLLPAVAGSLLAHQIASRHRLAIGLTVLFALASTGAIVVDASPWLTIALESALFFLAGAFFPLLLESAPAPQVPVLFAADSMGAFIGTLCVFFVPILYGIRSVTVTAVVVCATGGAWVLASTRGVRER